MQSAYRPVGRALVAIVARSALLAPSSRARALLWPVHAAGVTLAAQQPRITNGRVAAQPAGSPFAQSFRSLVSSQADVAWFGYAVPVVDGERVMCCFSGDTTWVNGNVVMSEGNGCCRACRLEPSADGTSMATRAPATAGTGTARNVVRLEGSDRMVVLFRVAERAVDRIRVFSEDCELDAGGRTVTWLEGVRPADSIAVLESYATPADGRRDRVDRRRDLGHRAPW